MRHYALLSLLLAFTLPATAQQAEAPPPPPLPEEAAVPPAEPEPLEPEVTIKRRGEDVIEEYRANGRLYMVKITPAKGYPYYLIDSDGDGRFDSRRNELDAPSINQWILLQW